MSQNSSQGTRVSLEKAQDYTDRYANSVQVRVSVWDFHLTFGNAHQDSAEEVTVSNFQGIYLSPQQAKAMWNVLGQNLAQYERTFGQLALEPVGNAVGPVN